MTQFLTCSSNLSASSLFFINSSSYIKALAVASDVACDNVNILLLMESIFNPKSEPFQFFNKASFYWSKINYLSICQLKYTSKTNCTIGRTQTDRRRIPVKSINISLDRKSNSYLIRLSLFLSRFSLLAFSCLIIYHILFEGQRRIFFTLKMNIGIMILDRHSHKSLFSLRICFH